MSSSLEPPIAVSDVPFEELQIQLVTLEKSYNAQKRNIAAAMRNVRKQEDALAQNFFSVRQMYLTEIDKRLGNPSGPGLRPMVHRAYLIARTDRRGRATSYGVFSEERPTPMIGETGGQVLIDTAESVISYEAAVRELLRKVESVA